MLLFSLAIGAHLCANQLMQTDSLDAEIKLRVPKWLKLKLKNIAAVQDLELSDIGRRALKEFAINVIKKEAEQARLAA